MSETELADAMEEITHDKIAREEIVKAALSGDAGAAELILVADLAKALDRDKTSVSLAMRKRGVEILRVRSHGYTNQLANAVRIGDAQAFVAYLKARGYEEHASVVGSDAVKSLVEAWRKA